jgi:hypothetical protein
MVIAIIATAIVVAVVNVTIEVSVQQKVRQRVWMVQVLRAKQVRVEVAKMVVTATVIAVRIIQSQKIKLQ